MGTTDERIVHPRECLTHGVGGMSKKDTNAQYRVETDIRRAAASSESQALHRPCPHVLYPRLQDMVPQLPGQARPNLCARAANTYRTGQIIEKDPLQPNGPPEMSLVEIGPRFVLTPIRIFEGAFGGATVFANPGTHLNLS